MAERITVNSKKPVSIKENLISHRRKTDFRSDSSTVNQILYLQKTIGNQAVQRLIKLGALQAKLKIGQPGDKYEQEADRVADAVMRMPEPGVRRQVGEEEEEELIQTKTLSEQITPLVQRQEGEEEEEEIQTKPLPSQTSEVVSDVETSINRIRGGGQSLPGSTRAFFEPRFGQDFSQVRLHTGAQAAESARAVNARAFTVGMNVVFGAGQYAPGTSEGRRLMAHELVHVVQQETGQSLRQHDRIGDEYCDIFEQAAEETTENVLREQTVASQKLAPFDVQCAAPTKTPACGPVELFTELDMPWPIPNNYFRGSTWMPEDTWKAALNATRKGKCEAKGEFEDVKLRWNLGNPRLGSYMGIIDLNENDIKFDINPHAIYAGKPCCPCFTGTASWSFDVEVSRKKGKTIERGKTKTPIKGSITGEKCDGKKCCTIGQTMKVNMAIGDTDISAKIRGGVRITGATYSG